MNEQERIQDLKEIIKRCGFLYSNLDDGKRQIIKGLSRKDYYKLYRRNNTSSIKPRQNFVDKKLRNEKERELWKQIRNV